MSINYSSRKIYKNSAVSVVCKGISAILSFISSPLILQCLGESKYGVWASLLSLVSWIYYFDLGIGAGLRIRLSESLAKEDIDGAQKYISTAYIIISRISLVAFAVAFIVTRVINLPAALNIKNFDENINMIFLVAILFVCINFVLSLINNVFYANQRAGAVDILSVLGQVCYVLGLFIYSRTGNGLILAITIIEGMAQIIKNVVGTIWARASYPNCRISLLKYDKKYSSGILSFGLMSFISSIAAMVLNSTDNLIIIHYFGAEAVTPYNFCYKYFGMISSIFMVIVVPLQSAYTVANQKDDYTWIVKNLKRAILLWCVFTCGTILAAFIFRPFMSLWLGRKLNYSNGLIFFTALYCILLMVGHTFSTLTNGLGKITETTIAALFQAIVNIPISILLAVNAGMGVVGVIIGSVISMMIAAIVTPTVAFREIKNMKKRHYEKESING